MFAAQQFAQVPGAALRCIAGTHREASLACAARFGLADVQHAEVMFAMPERKHPRRPPIAGRITGRRPGWDPLAVGVCDARPRGIASAPGFCATHRRWPPPLQSWRDGPPRRHGARLRRRPEALSRSLSGPIRAHAARRSLTSRASSANTRTCSAVVRDDSALTRPSSTPLRICSTFARSCSATWRARSASLRWCSVEVSGRAARKVIHSPLGK